MAPPRERRARRVEEPARVRRRALTVQPGAVKQRESKQQATGAARLGRVLSQPELEDEEPAQPAHGGRRRRLAGLR
eukprot:11174453-Lingulodinium_polyedra.AAC.1